MRDMRGDLSQWLDEIRGQKAELDQLEAAVTTALKAQEAHFDGRLPLFAMVGLQPITDPDVVAEFLETTMADGQEWSVDELVEAARSKGITFGDKSPKRVINMSLVNLYTNKKIEKVGERVWKRRLRRRLHPDLTANSDAEPN
jgi:hypothetical protein